MKLKNIWLLEPDYKQQNKTQQHSNVLYQLLLLQSRPTYLGAAGIAECVVWRRRVGVVEAATLEHDLNVPLEGVGGLLPALAHHRPLLGGSESQTGARDGKLYQEEQEQDDHVLRSSRKDTF